VPMCMLGKGRGGNLPTAGGADIWTLWFMDAMIRQTRWNVRQSAAQCRAAPPSLPF